MQQLSSVYSGKPFPAYGGVMQVKLFHNILHFNVSALHS